MSATLLKTKLYIPPARPNLVRRPRRLDHLNRGLHRKLTLVSAPPGFGKTTLVSEWIHHAAAPLTPQVAWLSLDEQDNDPVRFWSYFITALDTVHPGLGADALALLTSTQAPPIEDILIILINAAAELDAKIVLVLDDYHLINPDSIHHALTFLLDHLPPQLHLAMTSRSDPPLPLTRLRVRNQLTEVRDNDLRFTPAEGAFFFNHIMGVSLTPQEIMALDQRTEGWIAGLQLAALSMQGRDDAQGFVQAFTGSHRYIIDYLAEEVLNRQPPHLRAFLLRTAVLDRMCGPLCDALLAETASAGSSQEILEHLEQVNLFLIPLDDHRRWYRYHHLFADFLREYLRQTVDQAELNRLHQQASDWYAANHLLNEAVNHALAAQNINQAVTLIEQAMITLLTNGEINTIMGWLKLLPEDLIRTRPRLALGKGWALVITNQWEKMEPLLEYAEKALDTLDPADPAKSQGWSATDIRILRGEAAAMRAMLFGAQDRPAEAIALCQQALEQLPTNNPVVRSIILMTLGNAYEANGQLAQATQALTEAIELSRHNASNIVICLTATSNLADLEEEQGRLPQAAAYYHQGLEFVEELNRKRGTLFPGTRWAYIELAELHRQWNELTEAKRLLTIAMEMPRQINMLGGNLGIAYLVLSGILQAEGDWAGAQESLMQAQKTLPQSGIIQLWAEALQVRLWLRQGNLPAAAAWANSNPLEKPISPYPHPMGKSHYLKYPGEYTTLVRVYLAQERFEEAHHILNRMAGETVEANRWGRLLEVRLLQALAYYAQGNLIQALPLLAEALRLGEKGRYVRLFADEGRPMADLLRQAKSRGSGINPVYIDKLLAAIEQEPLPAVRPIEPLPVPIRPKAPPAPLIEPLSERELEVLRLVAEGYSNREIADKLYITVGTAKTHTINIYRKLEVNSRTQAVARAQDLDLL
jgi:LuxR family maltose regulon positive regulatory protein